MIELGPSCSGRIEVGARVVANPWKGSQGGGSWQQYLVVDETNLVCNATLLVHVAWYKLCMQKHHLRLMNSPCFHRAAQQPCKIQANATHFYNTSSWLFEQPCVRMQLAVPDSVTDESACQFVVNPGAQPSFLVQLQAMWQCWTAKMVTHVQQHDQA